MFHYLNSSVYSDTVISVALKYSLDPELIAGIIKQESDGNHLAFRFEPKFYERYLLGKTRQDLAGFVPLSLPTLATELMARASSWGLMQLMGDTARWAADIRNPYLTCLIDPEINIEAGSRYLHRLLKAHAARGQRDQVIAALTQWNGSPAYPWLVIDHIKEGRHLKFLPEGYVCDHKKWRGVFG